MTFFKRLFLSIYFVFALSGPYQHALASLAIEPLIFEDNNQKRIVSAVDEVFPQLSSLSYAAKCQGKLIAGHGGDDWLLRLTDTLHRLEEREWHLLFNDIDHSSITVSISEYGHEDSKFGLLFRHDEKKLTIVAFRGSIREEVPLSEAPDWIANKDCGLLSTEHNIQGHGGYITLANEIHEEIFNKLQGFYASLNKSLDHERILFIGQSLGGALGLQSLITLLPELGGQIFNDTYDNSIENHFSWIGFSTPPSVNVESVEAVEELIGLHNMLSLSVDFDPKRLLLHSDFWWGLHTGALRFFLGSAHSGFGRIGFESDIVTFILEDDYFTLPRGVDVGHKAALPFKEIYRMFLTKTPERGRFWSLKQTFSLVHTRFNGFGTHSATGEEVNELLNRETQGAFTLLNTGPWLAFTVFLG